MEIAFKRRRFRAEKPHGPCGLELVRATGRDEVAGLDAPSSMLDAQAGCPASHFGWTRACLTAFSDATSIEIVAARRDGELAGIAPLVWRRLHGVHRLLLAGASELGEPTDFAWDEEHTLQRLARALVRARSPLLLERLRADSAVPAALRRACRGRALVLVRPDAPYPYIALDESWVAPERHLDGRGRGSFRAARMRAEQFGAVATEIHTPNLDELPRLLDAAFELEAEDRTGRTTWPRNDPHRAVFYRQYAEAACMAGALRIGLLRIGGRVAAAQVGVESGGSFWLLLAGARARYAACSPGRLLARETIRYAAEANLTSYEFWGRTQPWTGAWSTQARECVSLRVYPLGLRGASALVADAAMAGWRAWRAGDSRPAPPK